jgi:Tol biopolymer transport system component
MDSNLWSLPINAQGESEGEPHPLTRNTNYRNTWPAISPDGERIVFVARRIGRAPEVLLMNIDGTGEEVLLPEPAGMLVCRHFTADGRGFFYIHGDRDSVQGEIVDLATRQTRRVGPVIATRDAVEAALGARLLADGRSVLMHGRRGAGVGVGLFDIETKQLRWLSPETKAMAYPTLTADENWVAAESFENHGSRLFVMPRAGGPPRPLTEGPGHAWAHSWSPGGDKVAFAGQREGAWNVYWKSRTSGAEKRLTAETSARVFVRYPEWAPQGNRLVFERVEVKGNVYVAPVEP